MDKNYAHGKYKMLDQLSQRDRAAGWVISFGQKWKTGTGRQYFTGIIGQLPTIHIIGLQSYRMRWKNAK